MPVGATRVFHSHRSALTKRDAGPPGGFHYSGCTCPLLSWTIMRWWHAVSQAGRAGGLSLPVGRHWVHSPIQQFCLRFTPFHQFPAVHTPCSCSLPTLTSVPLFLPLFLGRRQTWWGPSVQSCCSLHRNTELYQLFCFQQFQSNGGPASPEFYLFFS